MPRNRQLIVLTDKLNTLDRVILCASEFFGTATLVFIGCMSCIHVEKALPPTLLQIAIAFGLAVMLSVQTFGHISGSHINPIVTIAAVIMGDLALIEVPIYFVGQFAGAFAGYGLLMCITPIAYQTSIVRLFNPDTNATDIIHLGAGSPFVNPEISSLQGLFVEFLISLLLVWICCGVWDHRNATKHDSVPIKFGLAIAVLALVGAPYTGANMNPARSFAPAAWHSNWRTHWVYWLGPILSAFAGAGFYRVVFSKPKPQQIIDGIEITPLNERKG